MSILGVARCEAWLEITKIMKGELYAIFLASALALGTCQRVPGHMKPLGSHMDPLSIDSTTDFVTGIDFYDSYVSKNKPLLLKGLLSTTDAFQNWQDDGYLKQKFGKVSVSIENGKKENRSEMAEEMTLGDFIDVYKERDIYVVTDVPDEMKREWPFPSFLRCGGYTSNIAYINMWFSSGGTKSVLHSDTFENFHCVISGTKVFVMIEAKYSRDIGPEHESTGYYMLDVDAVDMAKYGGLSKVPWYNVSVEAGDCLYLPYKWLHQVNSYGRNLGVNIWWLPFDFSRDHCEGGNVPHGTFATISEFEMTPELQVKHFFLEKRRPDGTVHATDIYHAMKGRSPSHLTEDVFYKVFDILLPGCNGVITENDLHSIPTRKYKAAMSYAERRLSGYSEEDDVLDYEYYEEGPGDDVYYDHHWEEEWGGGDGHPRDEL